MCYLGKSIKRYIFILTYEFLTFDGHNSTGFKRAMSKESRFFFFNFVKIVFVISDDSLNLSFAPIE